MSLKPSLNVSLTPFLERFIAEQLASGRYQSASEVVRAGLRLLEKAERSDRGIRAPNEADGPDGVSAPAAAKLRRRAGRTERHA